MLARIGVAGAIAGNVMLASAALYAGWFGGMEHEWQRYFRWVSFVLVTPAIFWPGRVFFAGAWAALRARTLHMDVPIALGLAAGLRAGRGQHRSRLRARSTSTGSPCSSSCCSSAATCSSAASAPRRTAPSCSTRSRRRPRAWSTARATLHEVPVGGAAARNDRRGAAGRDARRPTASWRTGGRSSTSRCSPASRGPVRWAPGRRCSRAR